jgi:hypothetical protein
MLQSFSIPGKENEIKTEDFLSVLKLVEDKTGHKSKYSEFEIQDANILADQLTERMKQRKYALHTIFEKVNLD